jgi:hypothetical protein
MLDEVSGYSQLDDAAKARLPNDGVLHLNLAGSPTPNQPA